MNRRGRIKLLRFPDAYDHNLNKPKHVFRNVETCHRYISGTFSFRFKFHELFFQF